MPTRPTWLLVTCLATACAASPPTPRPSSALGQKLVLSAPDLEGREVDIGAAAGRVRVVDFWATWCEPCKDSMPVLDGLEKSLGARGLSVYGVSIDEDRAQIVEFLKHGPVSFPILWDHGAERVSRFDVRYMPVTLLVDRRGVIRHVHQGWDEAKARLQQKQIEALLAEP